MAKVEEDCIASIPLSRRLQTKTAATGLSITVDYTGARQPSMWSASDSTDDEHIVPARCRRPSSSSSQSSMSPVRVTFESAGSDEEDAWNLIPYNVPWGPSYFAYQAGTFPGPEGTSIFLRSPTPLKNQRTSQACKKCRERKAKVCIFYRLFCIVVLNLFMFSAAALGLLVIVVQPVVNLVTTTRRPNVRSGVLSIQGDLTRTLLPHRSNQTLSFTILGLWICRRCYKI